MPATITIEVEQLPGDAVNIQFKIKGGDTRDECQISAKILSLLQSTLEAMPSVHALLGLGVPVMQVKGPLDMKLVPIGTRIEYNLSNFEKLNEEKACQHPLPSEVI